MSHPSAPTIVTTAPSWGERVRPFFRDVPQVAEARARSNQARLSIILPVLLFMHAAHVVTFALVTRHGEVEQLWARRVMMAHAATGGLVLVVWLLGDLSRTRRPRDSYVPDLLGLLYLLHAAMLAGFNQSITPSVTPFLVAAFGVGLVLRLRRGPALIIYLAGLAGFLWLQRVLQPNAAVAISNQVNGLSVAAIGLVAAWTVDASFRRERMLEGLLNICRYCHSVKNREGSWEHLEAYVSKRAEVSFSHGVCEACDARQLGRD